MNLNNLTKEELINLINSKKEKINKYTKKYLSNKQAYRLWAACKQRAAISELEFDLEVEDIVIPKTCIYLGCTITNIYGEGRVWSNASVDRIDPDIGYVKGNIQVISDLANRMKQNASVDQLIAFAHNVLRLYSDNLNQHSINQD